MLNIFAFSIEKDKSQEMYCYAQQVTLENNTPIKYQLKIELLFNNHTRKTVLKIVAFPKFVVLNLLVIGIIDNSFMEWCIYSSICITPNDRKVMVIPLRSSEWCIYTRVYASLRWSLSYGNTSPLGRPMLTTITGQCSHFFSKFLKIKHVVIAIFWFIMKYAFKHVKRVQTSLVLVRLIRIQ